MAGVRRTDSPASSPPRHRIGRLREALYAAVVVIAVFGGAELALRVIAPFARTATLPEGMIRDHLRANSFAPDPDLYWYWKELPGDGRDELGCRLREPPFPPTPRDGVTRVVTLGDSQTLGPGVHDREVYSAVADAALGDDWAICNAALPGYRSLQVYRLLQRRFEAAAPDVVVVDCMPYDSPRDDGPLAVLPREPSWLQRLAWNSAIYYALRYAREKARAGRPRWLDQEPGYQPPNRDGLGNHDLIVAWGEQQGVEVVFLQYAVDGGTGEVRCHTRDGELPPGVPVVRACDALAATGEAPAELFLDNNHFTARGHRVVGELLADTLRGLGEAR